MHVSGNASDRHFRAEMNSKFRERRAFCLSEIRKMRNKNKKGSVQTKGKEKAEGEDLFVRIPGEQYVIHDEFLKQHPRYHGFGEYPGPA